MKIKLSIIFLIISFHSFSQYTIIPDANFENALSIYDDIPNDGQIPTANINTITNLNVSYKNISDLTGIEDFNAISKLLCYNNSLTNLNLSQNTNLTELYCYNNQLTSLDISQNTLLTDLLCYTNQITNIDLTQNTLLTRLNISSNSISNIDISQNTALSNFNCANNILSNLDVSQNIDLIQLNCSINSLTNLNINLNINLTTLTCFQNQLINLNTSNNLGLLVIVCYQNLLNDLDLRLNTSLVSLECYSNHLTNLDIRNGNNNAMSNQNFKAQSNPDLTCIFVDDAVWSTANWSNIDTTSTFVNNLSECELLDIDNLSLNSKISIYPNPIQNQIKILTDTYATYLLTNTSGKKLKKGKLQYGRNTLDVSNLSQGIYLLQIDNIDGIITKKIIKE